MKASKLLLKLQEEAELYKELVKAPDNNDNSINSVMSRYNYVNFQEILQVAFRGEDEDIPEKRIEDLGMRIDHYFSIHAPDDEDFRGFVKLISTYLVFIAKKPLHPQGTVFEDGSRVYRRDDTYICTGKTKFLEYELSLCRYCVCKSHASNG